MGTLSASMSASQRELPWEKDKGDEIDQLFSKLDKRTGSGLEGASDGKLSFREVQAYFVGKGYSKTTLNTLFGKFDGDKDNKLDRTEFRNLCTALEDSKSIAPKRVL